MSKTASVTFTFDGSRQSFERIYHSVCDVALEIGTSYEGNVGTIEFAIDDFDVFREDVARRSERIGVRLVAVDYLVSERRI